MHYHCFSLVLLVLTYSSQLAHGASYTLKEEYPTNDFFSKFDFFSCGIPREQCDPTHGFVQYVDHASAELSGLISSSNQSVIIRPDHTFTAEPSTFPGRKSVRLESKHYYNHGLFVIDVKRIPAGVCGTWPSIWLLGSNTVWPGKGEIDVVEGVNEMNKNAITLHTYQGCSTKVNNGISCQPQCGIAVDANNPVGSYGNPFNNNNGGVFAAEWTSTSIKVWFFPRGSAKISNALSNRPDPSTWGSPSGEFYGGTNCDIDRYFKDMRIVINLTFCGEWAGNVWGDTCRSTTNVPDCNTFVGMNPGAFTNVYWEILSLRVFEDRSTSPTRIITQPAATAARGGGSTGVGVGEGTGLGEEWRLRKQDGELK